MASQRQRRRKNSQRASAAGTGQRECLYCRSSENEFIGEEHILPFSLGNRDKVLPPGVVCRPCNNGPLSYLDSQLLGFEPIAFVRQYLNLTNREGKIPTARFANAHISRKPGDVLRIDCMNARDPMTRDPAHPASGTLTLTGRRVTGEQTRILVRALYKIALGFIRLDRGRAAAMSPRFDEAREMILGEVDFAGYLALVRRGKPQTSATFSYQDLEIAGVPTVVIFADLYGVQLVTDLDSRRVIDPTKVPRDEINLVEF